MRRHAKASTAGSTQRQVNRLGRFFRGGLANRGSAHGVKKGSSAPSVRRLAPARGLFGLACLAILALTALLGGGASSAVAAEECPNEIRRNEQGVFALRLPDCRAYEDVSPESRLVESVQGFPGKIRASADGNVVAYKSPYPAAGEQSGKYYLSRRGPNGWTRRNVVPQESPETQTVSTCSAEVAFSPDLSRNILEWDMDYFGYLYGGTGEFYPEGFCYDGEQVLAPGEARGYRNLLLHDPSVDSYELASRNEAEGADGNSYFLVGSKDFSTVAMASEAQLTSDAVGVTPNEPGGWNTFVWSNGVVRLATVLPDGTPVPALLARRSGEFSSSFSFEGGFGIYGEAGYEYSHSLSEDGTKLFFNYGGALYVRVNPAKSQSALSGGECTEPAKACTYQVDESQGPGASGGGVFEFASADGSKAFFTSDHKLTPDSTAVSGKEDLYEYNTETHELTDMTVNASEPADVWAISDISEDGSYVYFVAEAALEGSGATTPGSCEIYSAPTNTCNLYVRHNGTTTYIASILVDDSRLYDGPEFGLSVGHYAGDVLVKHHAPNNIPGAESSPNGRYFAFNSYADILGEGNGIYLYDATTDQLSCVSCGEGWEPTEFDDGPTQGIFPVAQFGGIGSVEPGTWRRNQVLDGGRVFLTTGRALVPEDTNGDGDAYMYANGQLHLISTGTEQATSSFLDATPSGSDVYFATGAHLLPVDQDGGGLTVYDARVNGGFPEPPSLPGCEGEACRSAGTNASNAGATGSAAFQGAGNQKQDHKRDCGLVAKRAQKLARAAKSLRRQANSAHDAELAKQLRQRSAKLAKQGRSLSKSAKRCRRTNRGAGK